MKTEREIKQARNALHQMCSIVLAAGKFHEKGASAFFDARAALSWVLDDTGNDYDKTLQKIMTEAAKILEKN